MIHNLTGQMIGHYQIIRPIEQGGMATVYLARDIHLQRQVAIKVFQFEEGERETQEFFYRFTREAQVVARLDHPNIVLVHDYGEQDNLAYLVMPYFANGSLKQLLNKRSRLPITEALHFILQLLNALQYAHNRGLIHRDIKPGNILFKNDQTPVLADFGLVKENITDNTGDITAIGLSSKQRPLTNGALMGTPYYMAPEQIRGQVQRQSDVYSIGLVLYEMLTGRLPFVDDKQGGLLTVLLKQANDPPLPITDLNPDISSQLGETIMRALEKDASQRYQSPTEFSEALRIAAPQYIGSLPEMEEHFQLNKSEYKNDPSPNDTSPLPTIELRPTPSSAENSPMQPSNTLIVGKPHISQRTQAIPHKRRLSYLLYGALVATLLVTLGFTSPLLLSLLRHPDNSAQRPVATQPNQSIIPPSVTQTSCPPTGKARAAVLAPKPYLSQGHNAVVYASSFYDNAGGEHGALMSYDIVTSKTHTIITVSGLLFGEQLSADGQWVIFSTSGVDPTVSRIQMVRIDGTELQTLYCSPSTLAYLLASPNLHPSQGWHLYLSEYITDQNSTMVVLNLLTGKVQHLNADRPYRPIAWQDDQLLYMREDNTHSPYDPNTQSSLALLTIHDNETSSVPDLWIRKDIPTFCSDVAFSTDFSTFFTSHCDGQGRANSSGDASATSEAPSYIESTKLAIDPPNEDKSTNFYTSSAQAITQIRTITSTNLLFLVGNEDQYGGQNGLWEINTDGTGKQRLSTEKIDPTFFNHYSQYPWSNVSTDGSSYYVIRTASTQVTGSDQLFVGSLNGDQSKVIAADGVGGINKKSKLEVAGWTTI